MQKKILMVAAENDGLPGAKVGGVGDVIRDLPSALADQSQKVDVVIPSYGFLSRLDDLIVVAKFEVQFANQIVNLTLLQMPESHSGVRQYILHHPTAFSEKGETVYCNDDDGQPFATDATKFALFSLAIAQALKIGVLDWPDVLHCHDWHTAFLFILVKYHGVFKDLQSIKTVFTIHNLAMQGVRPLSGDKSSMSGWFPGLSYDLEVVKDLRHPECVNPMRAAILLADKVHTVSPTYAKEILSPSQHEKGVYGGEGLEYELKSRAYTGCLIGIINGCEYPENTKYTKPSRKKVDEIISQNIERWASKSPEMKSAHWVAHKRLEKWVLKKTTGITITSIGRVTEQKVRLLQARIKGHKTALENILDYLGGDGTLFLLGSGDPKLEEFLLNVAGDYTNFIFLNGYSDGLSKVLYKYGDLFLMPSSFEPCGISQMLAMRAGQPCLVNGVGGLKDTVQNGENGYSFSGYGFEEQAENLLSTFKTAVKDFQQKPEAWKRLKKAASSTRFTWKVSADEHIRLLYS